MNGLRMVQITFTRNAGGKPNYYRVSEKALEAFRLAYGRGNVDAVLTDDQGNNHTFTPGTIRTITDRPYDPQYPKRRRK